MDASGETTLVEGDSDMLIPLSYTEYLDGQPALFFSAQTESLEILSKVDTILVTESVDGVILDLIGNNYQLYLSKRKPVTFRPRSYSLYEMWMKGEHTVCVHINTDKDTYSFPPSEKRHRRWSKLGEIELREDEYQFSIVGEPGEGIAMVVIPKKIMEESKKEVENKGVNYFYFINKEDTP